MGLCVVVAALYMPSPHRTHIRTGMQPKQVQRMYRHRRKRTCSPLAAARRWEGPVCMGGCAYV